VDPSGEFGLLGFVVAVVAVVAIADYVVDLAIDYLEVFDKGDYYSKTGRAYKAGSNGNFSKAGKLLMKQMKILAKLLMEIFVD